MAYIVPKDQGVYDNTKRYAFTNITTEPFISKWGGQEIVIPAGETHEFEQHLANKLTDELVDKIMIGNAKLDEVTYYEKHPDMQANSFVSPRAGSLGVPAARLEFEEQIVRELALDEESPEIQVMRAKIREELKADMSQEKSTQAPTAPISENEFADLTNGGQEEVKAPKPALKTKKIKVE